MTFSDINKYTKSNSAWFFSSKDQNWFLSNMAAGLLINYRGHIWNSSEQLYQASKYASDVICIPNSKKNADSIEPKVRERIKYCKNAMGSKMTQKCAVKAGLVRVDWESIMIDHMRYVLELKLFNNPAKFSMALDQTDNLPIVEISRKDDFWGCKKQGVYYVGRNVLGKLLTDIRNRKETIIAGKFVEPVNFWLS